MHEVQTIRYLPYQGGIAAQYGDFFPGRSFMVRVAQQVLHGPPAGPFAVLQEFDVHRSRISCRCCSMCSKGISTDACV